MKASLKSFNVLLLILLPACITGGLLIFAGNLSDGLRLGFLSLPGVLFTYLAIIRNKRSWHIIAIVWWFIFWLDALLRSSTWYLFNSDNEAYFIIEAIANTNHNEIWEFFQLHLKTVASVVFSLILAISIYSFSVMKLIKPIDLKQLWNSKIYRSCIVLLLLLTTTSYLMKPSRKVHPVVFWSEYQTKIQDFKDRIKKHKNVHEQWDISAKENLVVSKQTKHKQTHVLVLSESLTSLNLGVCGYARETTPELSKRVHDIQVFCNAFSPSPSTINALRVLLTESLAAEHNQYSPESILAYARAAGYKIYWLSNQDDTYLSSLFGSYADHAIYKNNRSGRSSTSLDESLIPAYQQALADPDPKKLIILHLIGVHPNYQERYPTAFNKFTSNSNDQVELELKSRNIDPWIRSLRNDYDNAVLYEDSLLAQFLDTLRSDQVPDFRSFTVVSDHGNEVGHELDYAGHSPNTKAGYQVPIIMWSDNLKMTGANKDKTINTAELDNNLMHIMGLREKNAPSQTFWQDDNYQFIPEINWPYWKNKF
ncbi:sulfatase-like hydrolase/transferase [Acinetobacter beijerinckii]|uniref:phosphoethanolamine transferase n=1 Tax=Acinetobacter beijerinckii TaxID=262668 RepID=UPI0023DDD067|nr:phosphoethanolamine transferase [Acinetobacter beijerinckii]MDF2418743.1 sulfatase-like hydrolase/transferase [Acinetobacter beijerinckii]